MFDSILHPYEWSTVDTQYFLAVDSKKNEVTLHKSIYSVSIPIKFYLINEILNCAKLTLYSE